MLSAKEIASQIGSKNPEAPQMLDRLLRLLASHSLLRCSVSQQDHSHRLYSLSRSPLAPRPTLALLLDNVFYQSWKEVKGAIMEGGIPFNRAYGMHAFEYPGVDQRFNEVFNIKTLVDVGGGFGVNLHLITSKYPHVKAIINFDLPQHAPLYAGKISAITQFIETLTMANYCIGKELMN
ncbi:cathecol O-methyltransferase 1-like [Arachis stenosperma]|uniref:cathecol O-methyltransferase 1-like n=1 Tax=Arachis stenosperma TaxID=217475 RepID=UPI0025ACEBFC|nr:cathecol O-methyltransferase 1-like [Arachis stenosperma]